MDDPKANKLRLAIVGAGIGGLSLAVAISKLDHSKDIEVHIFEATSELGETGLGLTVLHRTWELLRSLGCHELIKKRAFSYSRMGTSEVNNDAALVFRKSDQQDGFTFLNFSLPGGTWALHRSDLHQALLNGLNDKSHVHLSSRVIDCNEQRDTVTLKFQDGTTADFDFVVGADGIKSVIRRDFITASLPNEIDRISPVLSGTKGYRALISRETLEKRSPNHRALRTPLSYCGKNKHIISYPIAMGSLVNVVAFFSHPEEEGNPLVEDPVREVSLQEVLDRFEGWEEECMELLRCMNEPSCWAFLTTKPISSYGLGRIALLGDAAHAMTPHLASGAGQAMEDGYILATLITIGVQDGVDVSRMIEVYNTIRQPMGNFVLNNSRRQGFRFELNAAGFEDIQENEPVQMNRMVGLAEEIIRGWRWVWTTSVLEDQKRAMALI
ncbi:hypothetical protein D9756_010527 [Leucocoprinus leucothites]|uniref:FAD-binding domain-containing protein n=1 Tax=Leucocoprinus leucothites TaxID=201217 RepID=A0A8H5FTA1_9AGAR|nr:hypothetical protein D9756_010527 [Leucoagaricus leucothites]